MHFFQKTFLWEGINQHREAVKGEISVINSKFIKLILRKKGIVVQKIRRKPLLTFRSTKIYSKDITLFTRQISTLIIAGLPLLQSLQIIARGYHISAMRELIDHLQTSIEKGNSVSHTLNEHPRHFNELYRNLVLAGEQSGTLDILFDRIATHREKTAALIAKIKKALYYPIAVISIAVMVAIVLLIFVIPQFQTLYAKYGAVLPYPTRVVIHLSEFIQHFWWIFILVIIIIIAGFSSALRHSEFFAITIDRLILQFPAIGKILEKSAIAKFCRALAITFASGLPLINALQIVAGTTGNRIFTQAILQMREFVTTGQPLHVATRQTKIFPHIMIQMIAVGEESGALEKMLCKIADIFEREVDDMVQSFGSLIEPLIMIILGTLIGGFVIAMYLPIFKLGSVI